MADYRKVAGILMGDEPAFGPPAPRVKPPAIQGVVQALDPDAFERQYQGNQANEPAQESKLWGQIKEAWNSPNQQALLSFGGGAGNGNDVGILGKLVAPIPGMDPTGKRTAQGLPEAIQNTAHTISPNGLWDMAKGVYDSANRLTTPVDDAKGYQELGDSYVPYNGTKKIIDAFNVAGALPLAGAPAALMREGAGVGMAGGKLAKTADNALDMSHEARMARAKAGGFHLETPYYRGSSAEETAARPNTWVASSPEYANAFARGDGANVSKVFVRGKFSPGEWSLSPEEALRAGFDGRGAPDGTVQVFDPRNIRSVNAAFDPAKRDSANLLAANPTAAAPFAIQNQDQSKRAALIAALQAAGQ